jgi:hypothetical protein
MNLSSTYDTSGMGVGVFQKGPVQRLYRNTRRDQKQLES